MAEKRQRPEKRRVPQGDLDSDYSAAVPSRNAVLARENRIRKKKYVTLLEGQVRSLRHASERARGQLANQAAHILELQRDVEYLRAVLRNSRELSLLLARLGPSTAPAPGSPWSSHTFPDCELLSELSPPEHSYARAPEKVGVCLHVSDGNISLEFCSKCNEDALANFDS